MQILFLGPPGAGKGTQCKRLSASLKLPHLSSGDLLREAVANGTEAGKKAKEFMDKGNLVPDEVLIKMFREKLSSPECAKGFILDGFPRNVPQAKALDGLLKELHKELDSVINLTVDEAKLKERLVGRRSCSNKACGAIYHIKFNPPQKENICDLCGSPLSHRSDDKEEVVAARLQTYREQTAPLIAYYKQRNILKDVDGDGPADQIFFSLEKVVHVRA
jgi:adenylate kinase